MNISTEANFVLQCSRAQDEGDPAATAAAAGSVQDWALVADLSGRHRVAGFVLQALLRMDLPAPAFAVDALRITARQTRARCMLLDATLEPIAALLAQRSIPLIILKGPALARTIYPSPALRPYDDLDLTVAPEDEAGTGDALRQLGFCELPDAAEDAWHFASGHVPGTTAFHRRFTAGDGRGLIEIHTDPLQLGLTPVCEADRWQRARPIPGLASGTMLCPEDQIVQLSVHAHKHGFDRLIWLKDLDLLLRSSAQEFDWNLARAVASAEGVRTSLWYSLYLAALLLHTPVPSSVLQALRPAPWIEALCKRVSPVEPVANLSGQMRRRAVQFRGADVWRGTLPGLLLMGRRRARARAATHVLVRRLLSIEARKGRTSTPAPGAQAVHGPALRTHRDSVHRRAYGPAARCGLQGGNDRGGLQQ